MIQREDDFAVAMDDFARLHNARRSQKNQPGIFDTVAQRNFYFDVFRRFLRSGALELSFLRVGDQRIAVICQFSSNQGIHYYQTGYDLSWEKSNVGFVLLVVMIERAVNQGRAFYELLRGQEDYKYRLGEVRERKLRDLYLTKGSLFGAIYFILRLINRKARKSTKSILRLISARRPADKVGTGSDAT